MVFSGWYGNGTWALFRRLMKYKIQTLGAGKHPNDDMCRAIAAMFPTTIDETNVHLTRVDEPLSYLSQSKFSDYIIEGDASTIAAEVRSTAMAAHRYRIKHYKRRNKRHGDGDVDVAMNDADVEDATEVGAARVHTPEPDEDDAALIGLESESEGEESEAEAGDEGDDED
jgi:hypothetical protein